MSQSLKKFKEDPDTTVSGYIFKVTPVKVLAKNFMYFEAMIQTGKDEHHRCVVFTPDKHRDFEQASATKTAVKQCPIKKVMWKHVPFVI